MDNANILVSRLKEWAKTNKVPITQELTQIERKLAKSASKTSTRSKNGEKQKLSKKPDKANNVQATLSSGKIDFNIQKMVLAVKGSCHFCKAKSASQIVYTLTNSKKVIVCGNCVGKQQKRNKNRTKAKVTYVDAMERLVPGSYGSGRKSR